VDADKEWVDEHQAWASSSRTGGKFNLKQALDEYLETLRGTYKIESKPFSSRKPKTARIGVSS
jgi:hypothetical protein